MAREASKPSKYDTEESQEASAIELSDSEDTARPQDPKRSKASDMPATRKRRSERRSSWAENKEAFDQALEELASFDSTDEVKNWFEKQPDLAASVAISLAMFHGDSQETEQDLNKRVELLESQLQQAGQETYDVEQERKALEESRRTLRAEVRRQAERIDLLERDTSVPLSSHAESAPKSKKIPDIAEWSGGTPQQFRSWQTDLRVKMRANADHFPQDSLKTAYILSRLREEPREYIEAFLDDELAISFDEILKLLVKRYDDPNRLQTARTEYSSLKQLSTDLPTFLGNFYRLAAAARIPEDWQMADLKNKLNDRFHARITGQRFTDLAEMVHFLEDVDHDMKIRDRDKVNRPNSRKPGVNRPIGTTSGQGRQTSYSKASSEEPTEKREGQRGPAICWRCQQEGHISRNCPQAKVEPPSKS